MSNVKDIEAKFKEYGFGRDFVNIREDASFLDEPFDRASDEAVKGRTKTKLKIVAYLQGLCYSARSESETAERASKLLSDLETYLGMKRKK